MVSFDFLEMKFPAKADYVGVARLTTSGIATRMGFNYEEIEDLKVAISEAISNVVTHAYEGEGKVKVGFKIYPNRLEIIVVDRGESFDLAEIKDDIGPYLAHEPLESLREGGFGLFLIKALMNKVEFNTDHGVIVRITKYLGKTGVGLDDQISKVQERKG